MAAEAGVAYGLVYHYFDSKDQMLNELFSERWALLVEASQEIRQSDVAAHATSSPAWPTSSSSPTGTSPS